MTDKTTRKMAAKFNRLADGMQRQIDRLNEPAFANSNPTARRNRIAASKAERAREAEQLQAKLRAIAQAWEADTLHEALRGVTQKAQVEWLMWRYWPEPFVRKWDLRQITTQCGDLFQTRLDDQAFVILSQLLDSSESMLYLDAGQREAIHQLEKLAGEKVDGNLADYQRLVKAGITDAQQFQQAAEALAALDIGTAGQQSLADQIHELERELMTRKMDGFFPTPAALAARMVGLAELEPGLRVLEPSAGSGALADAITAAEPAVELEVIEVNGRLVELLRMKGYTVEQADFLTVGSGERYDRVIMNPPFANRQDAQHIQHAFRLLKPGGLLVAITGEGMWFRADYDGFHEWLESRYIDIRTSAKLPEGTFKESGTGVNTRLLVLEKLPVCAACDQGMSMETAVQSDDGWLCEDCAARAAQVLEGYVKGETRLHGPDLLYIQKLTGLTPHPVQRIAETLDPHEMKQMKQERLL